MVATPFFGTTGTCLRELAQRWPEKPALLAEERRLTFADYDAEANRLAHYLRDAGVRKGANVGLVLFNCIELATALVAVHRLGAVACLWNFRLASGDIGYLVRKSQAPLIIFNADFQATVRAASALAGATPRYLCVEKADAAAQVEHLAAALAGAPAHEPPDAAPQADDPCTVIYTSGTTGRPKGAAFTHASQALSAIQYSLEMGLDRGHVGLSAAPIIHGAATNFFAAFHFMGATQVLCGRYEARKVLRQINEHRVTELMAVPTQMEEIARLGAEQGGRATPTLRLIRSGGSRLTPRVVERVKAALGSDILNTYGMTENCSNTTAFSTAIDPPEKYASIGKATHFWELRVVTDDRQREVSPDEVITPPGRGQLIVRGRQNIRSYYLAPDEPLRLRDGWLYTRDIVEVDDDGYMFLVDRIDNIIISGGINIYPQEVEQVLLEHPQVREAAVIGVPDAKWDEAVAAIIVPQDTALSAAELDAYCRRHEGLANFKRPRHFFFVDALPRNVLGKVERERLKKEYAGLAGAQDAAATAGPPAAAKPSRPTA